MLLRRLVEDISKAESRPSFRTISTEYPKPLRKPGAPVRIPFLLRLPVETRTQIYDFLIPGTVITLHYHRLINVPKQPLGYTSPPASAGQVLRCFRLPTPEPLECHEWDNYTVLYNGAFGITETHPILRQETLVRVLQEATFQCDADEAIGVFTTMIPKLWRPHVRNFAGWIQKGVPAIPTDHGRFPNLRKVQLNVPNPAFDLTNYALELQWFKKTDVKKFIPGVLQAVDAIADKEGSESVINALMLVRTMPCLEWVVRRECCVAGTHYDLREKCEARQKKEECGLFMLEYNSKTGVLTRTFDRDNFVSNHVKMVPDADAQERWTISDEAL